jgi:hypothetical protein
VFKPHPRDKNLGRYSSLDCFVDTNNTISQEAILSSLSTKPIAVLSFTSTALVTTKLFCDVDTYSLIRLFDSEDVQLTLQNEFNNFAKTFDEVVKIPNTIDELINNITL